MVDLTVDNNTATTKRDEQQQQDGTMTLTDGERQRISKYVDLEFQDAKPDKKAKTADQFLFEEKHGLEDDTNESLDDVDKAPEGQKMLEPRAYQYELYQKATQENVIAVLDTGSGKTLIAVMLIKDMVNKEKQERLTRRHTKLTFFLVDRVPLVFQQASVIEANCDARVQSMCGQMDVDSWSEKKWRQIFEENDVCVMTAQIFLDTLRHGFIHMEQVNLLIFDECHHATKRHPYNLIMREFYERCDKDKRPKIFGMTASPMHAKTGVQYSAVHLERNLHSRIYTATNIELLAPTLNKPREITLEYAPSEGYDQTELTKAIRKKLGAIERFKRCFYITSNVLSHLGPWCCDRLWRHILGELDERVSMDTQDMPKEQLMEEDRLVREAYELTIGVAPDDPDFLDTKLFTSKVGKLMSALAIYADNMPEFCGIVFVERRHTAITICMLIEACSRFKGKLRCGVLIGHGTTNEGDIQMKFNEQNRVIQKFRNGELNLLIATNVAEEGLDIQPCNVVIRFDFFHTLIGYIQSRGRARRPASKYIMLMEQSNASQAARLAEFRQLETDMKEFCRSLPEERNMALKFANGLYDDPNEDGYDSDDDDEDFNERIYLIPSTGATITMHSAVPLIHRYCGSLPSDSFCILQPIFEVFPTNDGFTCTLRLPSNAAIREVTSETARTKGKAKRMAALDACKELHKLGAFDDHLLPKNYKREILGEMAPQVDENGNIIGSRRRRGIYEKRTPRFWEREEEKLPEEENVQMEDLQNGEVSSERERALINGLNVSRRRKEPAHAGLNNTTTYTDGAVSVQKGPFVINTVPLVPGKMNGSQAKPVTTNNTDAMSEPLSSQNQNGDLGVASSHENGAIMETDTADKATNEEANKAKEGEEDIGEGPFTLWMTVIDIDLSKGVFGDDPIRRMSFLTWKEFPQLPTIELFTKVASFQVVCRSFSESFQVDREVLDTLANFTLKLVSSITNKTFSCPLGKFPYFLAPLRSMNGDSLFGSNSEYMQWIDWDEISLALEKNTIPVELDRLEESLKDRIIIDYSDNQRRYYVQGICNELTPMSSIPEDMKIRETGYENFAAYYKEIYKLEVTRPDQPLVRVKRIAKVMNYLMPVPPEAAKDKGRTATFVIPEFCNLFTISASVFRSAMLIPSIMTRVDSFLLVREACARYDIPANDPLMLEAYTTPSASMAMNYERLETLGDSLLKFIATIRLYINFPFSNEGELHCLRIRVICNRALYRAAKRLKIFRFVTSHAFNRRYWRPHHFVASTDTEDTLKDTRQHMLSDKTLADIVEASLGAAYLSSGLEGGLHCAIAMQIPFDEIKTWSDFWPAYLESRDKIPPRAEVKALRSLSVSRVQEIAGYVFNTPLLIVEALTHASLPNSTAPCYQRLEFLGDAILDFLVIRYLYDKYPSADPGLITDLKDSCVNNHVLGVICIEIQLHTQIIHYSGRLVRAIEEFVNELESVKQRGEAHGEYWTDMTVPKVLSDVVESMLGAVFVDAGFDLTPVEKVFQNWMIPLYDKHVTPETLKIHPLRKLTTDLQRMGCDCFMLRNHTTQSNAPDSQKCVIFLHDKPLATGSADNIKAARRNAATKASQRLEEEPDLLERICDCGILERKRKRYMEDDDEDED